MRIEREITMKLKKLSIKFLSLICALSLGVHSVYAGTTEFFSHDFENYADTSAVSADWTLVTPELIDLEAIEGNKKLKLGLDEATTVTGIKKVFDACVNSGIVKIKFSMMMENDGVFILWGYDEADRQIPLFTIGAGKAVFSTWDYGLGGMFSLGNFAPNTWYDIEISLDVGKQIETIRYMMGATTLAEMSMDFNNPEWAKYNQSFDYIPGTSLKSLYFETGYNFVNNVYLDDVSVNYECGKPEINSERIKFIRYDGTETDTLEASTKKISFDFGTAVKQERLTAENILITNLTDSTTDLITESYTGTLFGGVYTIEFTNMFKPNKQYEIKVSGDIENILGEKIGSDYTQTEETKSGELKYGLKLFKGTNEITAFESVTAGAHNVVIDYVNTTNVAQEPIVFISFYSGNKLVKTAYKKTNAMSISSDVKQAELRVAHFFNGLTGVDKIKIFVVDGNNNWTPLSSALVIE